MEAPFARRLVLPLGAPIHPEEHDVVRGHLVVGQACRRDQKAVPPAQADVAGGPLVEAGAVHLEAGRDDTFAELQFGHCWFLPSAGSL